MRYHFIGICGISMSALAVHLSHTGNVVQGSDIKPNEIADVLKSENIKVFTGHNGENIKGCDIVVYNFAIEQSNPEIIYAKKHNIKIISRAELLADISRQYKNVIAVAGSHGKTTTTAMLYSCLKSAMLNPSLHIGGIIQGEKVGFIEGKDEYFVTEACEYHDSFLLLKANIGIILNIEPEHLDYFKTYENELKSYQKFASNSTITIITKDFYGINIPKVNIFAKNINSSEHGQSFDVFIDNMFYMYIDLNAYGKYNVDNALSVIATCKLLGIDKKYIYGGLKNFKCIKRRFEIIKKSPKLIVHDYAHHPTQIKDTLLTFKEHCKGNKILVVFQPHTYSRTKAFFNEFLNCFKVANKVFIIKTYPAREKHDKTASGYMLYKKLKDRQKCQYFASFKRAKKAIEKEVKNGYNVLILGAGDIDKLAYTF